MLFLVNPTPNCKLKPRPQLARQSFAPDESKNQAPGFRTAQEVADSFGLPKYGKSADYFWEYQDNHGNPVIYVFRWNTIVNGKTSKDYRPVSKCKDVLWRLGSPKGQLLPLYNLPSLADATIVVVCEGEKAADAAIELGFTATTSIGGSQAASKTDWSPLTEKEVWFLPDNDEPGQKYVNQGATILKGLDSETPVKILMLPYLPPKGDLADWRRWPLSNGWKKTGITNIAAKTDLFQLPTATDENGSGCLPVPLEVFPQSITEYIKATAAAGTGMRHRLLLTSFLQWLQREFMGQRVQTRQEILSRRSRRRPVPHAVLPTLLPADTRTTVGRASTRPPGRCLLRGHGVRLGSHAQAGR